ncbi:MAG: hypothetical protein ABSH47_07350 [Bryobacteraceae bacterium]|jgi:hypothetical protein
MKSDDQTIEVEITIVPAKGRQGGQRRGTSESKMPDPPRIPRIARLMALAIKFQGMIDRREVQDYAEIARLGYVTRARLTQIMNLLLLAPDIQEHLLSLPCSSAVRETHLRGTASDIHWVEQRRRFEDAVASI